MSFWCRALDGTFPLPQVNGLPNWSARIWTSMCGPSTNFFDVHSHRCRKPLPPRSAILQHPFHFSRLRAIRIPRPPPPRAALIITGYPMLSATSMASFSSATGPLPEHHRHTGLGHDLFGLRLIPPSVPYTASMAR